MADNPQKKPKHIVPPGLLKAVNKIKGKARKGVTDPGTSRPTPAWIADYFGQHKAELSPVEVMAGDRYAVVKVRNSRTDGYILVRKLGRYLVDSHRVLHTGYATQTDLDWMSSELQKAEAAPWSVKTSGDKQ